MVYGFRFQMVKVSAEGYESSRSGNFNLILNRMVKLVPSKYSIEHNHLWGCPLLLKGTVNDTQEVESRVLFHSFIYAIQLKRQSHLAPVVFKNSLKIWFNTRFYLIGSKHCQICQMWNFHTTNPQLKSTLRLGETWFTFPRWISIM